MAPMRDAVHLLASAVLSELPTDAHLLCVGVGTGAEILHLARKFPRWRFTAVDPSAAMLDVFRRRAGEQGIATRCALHQGYVDSLPLSASFDAATALLVSQFILDPKERSHFFHNIARRLRPGGILVSSDLAADLHSATYRELLEVWLRLNKTADISPEEIERMRSVCGRDVAILPAESIGEIIRQGGFAPPVLFFQAALLHAWYARRSPNPIEPARPA